MPRIGCMLGLFLCLATLAPLQAAEIRYVDSADSKLNVRRGPGFEHAVVARLPHGTRVVLHERLGLWYRIFSAREEAEGWVQQRYLVAKPPVAADITVDMSRQQERQRFARLRRKGIIRVRGHRSKVLRITIDPLTWRRLLPHEQSNFLQRAHRLYGIAVVEMHNVRNDALLARLTVTGEDQFHLEVPQPQEEADRTTLEPSSTDVEAVTPRGQER